MSASAAASAAVSPFMAHSNTSACAAVDDTVLVDSDQEPVREDVSDGLTFLSKSSSWFCPTYTRSDCRCGQCSIGDPEPCTYARPNSAASSTTVGSVLLVGRRSLSRLLSSRDSLVKDLHKDT